MRVIRALLARRYDGETEVCACGSPKFKGRPCPKCGAS